jgi:hypothetical protein
MHKCKNVIASASDSIYRKFRGFHGGEEYYFGLAMYDTIEWGIWVRMLKVQQNSPYLD